MSAAPSFNTGRQAAPSSSMMAGAGIVSLHMDGRTTAAGRLGSGGTTVDARTKEEKQAAIVEYLQRLPSDAKASAGDVSRELNIDIADGNLNVLEMLQSNPKVLVELSADGSEITFQFVKPHVIRNQQELISVINRVRSGVLFADIQHCYPDIGADCHNLITSGEHVIACSNKEKKSFVLYPRLRPYYSELSGRVTATPGSSLLRTDVDFTKEIQRGEAICVGGMWFRVSMAIGNGSPEQQLLRSSPKHSVTWDKEYSKMNVYHEHFTADTLPLAGGADADLHVVKGKAKRHGCTKDIKTKWASTIDDVKKYKDDEELEKRLLELGLITCKAEPEVMSEPEEVEEDTSGKKTKRRRRNPKTVTGIVSLS